MAGADDNIVRGHTGDLADDRLHLGNRIRRDGGLVDDHYAEMLRAFVQKQDAHGERVVNAGKAVDRKYAGRYLDVGMPRAGGEGCGICRRCQTHQHGREYPADTLVAHVRPLPFTPGPRRARKPCFIAKGVVKRPVRIC